jgi:hypothetical protein
LKKKLNKIASKVWKLLWVADNQIDNNRKMQSLSPYKISSKRLLWWANIKWCIDMLFVRRKNVDLNVLNVIATFFAIQNKNGIYTMKKQHFMFTNLLTKPSTAGNLAKA